MRIENPNKASLANKKNRKHEKVAGKATFREKLKKGKGGKLTNFPPRGRRHSSGVQQK